MMKKDFLLEIFTEELPPNNVKRMTKHLSQYICEGLENAKLTFEKGDHILATPRRIAVLLKKIPTRQPDQETERKGPLVSIAFNADGTPTKQAIGFATSCGISVDKLKRIDTPKGECIYFKKKERGKLTTELLPDIINNAITKLPIAKYMRWGKHETQFVRPVHSVILLYGHRVLSTTVLGQTTGNKTTGHRVYTHAPLAIESPRSYINVMKHAHVIIDFNARKKIIEQQIAKLTKKHRCHALINDALLEEVTAATEWPTALFATFSKDFLTVPREALIASIEKHQRCFPIVNKENQLLAKFITIANIDSRKPKLIINGNERVMHARLADAKFFYELDQKNALSTHVDSLKKVVFQKQLGTLFDKTVRVQSLAKYIANKLNTPSDLVERAAYLSKTDLMTTMVGEFPELQGIMGYYYAKHDNEPNEVAIALKEQYMPRFADDDLPKTITGQILAIADRMDTLIGFFGINQIPSGNKDPYALRRAALGVIRIIIEKSLPLDFNALVQHACENFQTHHIELPTKNLGVAIGGFFLDRLSGFVAQQGFTRDQYLSTLGGPVWHNNLLLFYKRLEAVKYFAALPESENLAAANKRVSNILSKQSKRLANCQFKMELLKEEAEIQLARAIAQKTENAENFATNHDYCDLLVDLASLQEPIDVFFEKIMVMTDDEAVCNNRLALLAKLRALFLKVADISLLNITR